MFKKRAPADSLQEYENLLTRLRYTAASVEGKASDLQRLADDTAREAATMREFIKSYEEFIELVKAHKERQE